MHVFAPPRCLPPAMPAKDTKKKLKEAKLKHATKKDAKELGDTQTKVKPPKQANNKTIGLRKSIAKKPASLSSVREVKEWNDVKIGSDGLTGKLIGLAWDKISGQVIEMWDWSPAMSRVLHHD